MVRICKECSWESSASGHGRLLKTVDRDTKGVDTVEDALSDVVREVHQMLGVDVDETHDELHVYLDAGVDLDAGETWAINDVYNPTGALEFTQPVQASVHIIIGQVSQSVIGQRKGVKCGYGSRSVERIIMRSEELVITDMNFNKTHAIPLGRSSVVHEPVAHVILLWTRLVPRFLGQVCSTGSKEGHFTALKTLHRCGADVPSLALVEPKGMNEGPRIGNPSVTIVKPAAFSRWASNDGSARTCL